MKSICMCIVYRQHSSGSYIRDFCLLFNSQTNISSYMMDKLVSVMLLFAVLQEIHGYTATNEWQKSLKKEDRKIDNYTRQVKSHWSRKREDNNNNTIANDSFVETEAWKQNVGVWPRYIPYKIVNTLRTEEKDAVMSSINMIEKATCLTFVEHTNEYYYIKLTGDRMRYYYSIHDSNRCLSSEIGKAAGFQVIALPKGCTEAIPAHKIMNALGRVDEHQRPDRNNYIKINYFNLLRVGGAVSLGDLKIYHADTQGIPYDYESLTHPGKYAFSKNGLPTFEPINVNPPGPKTGQRTHLSVFDILHLNTKYCPEKVVRLVGGSTHLEGRVEVQWKGSKGLEWGTVSSDSFDITDAKVFCNFLGYPEATQVYFDNRFGQGKYEQPVWMDEMKCIGTENTPFLCPQSTISQHPIDHYKDVGISCKTNVRLTSKQLKFHGRVEVFVDGKWGVICTDSFDIHKEGNVLCRQLGYARGGYWHGIGRHESTLPIVLDDLQCTGDEEQITHCQQTKTTWKASCDSNQIVFLACSG